MIYFDAYTQIGPFPRKHPAQPWSLDHLKREMAHCSISGALVSSQMSVRYDPMHENRRLSAALEGELGLFPVWNVMPHWTDEFPEPAELVRLLDGNDVRAVTVYPKTNGWDLKSSRNGMLLDALAKRQVLTIVQLNEFADTGELEWLVAGRPDLPVLVAEAGWSTARKLVPLLLEYPNLHLCFDRFQCHRALEFLVARGCENQLLFGSRAPLMSMGAHRTYVDYADMPGEAREKIASGNLIRLLKGQRPARETLNPQEDDLMNAARCGEPLPTPVFDMHAHILHEGLNGAGGSYAMADGGPSGVLALMKRVGCDGVGFMSWQGTVSSDAKAGNDCVRQALDALPDSCWGLGTVDPTHYTASEMKRQIENLFADRRFLGMKPYVHYGVAYDDPRYDVWWEACERHRCYVLLHATRPDCSEADNLAGRYPNVTWVPVHCGASYDAADKAIAVARRHPNILLEITYTSVPLGVIEYMAEQVGADRILYGTDMPMRDPRQQLGWVVYSRLPVEDKRKILGGNARALLDRIRAHRGAPLSH